jgi:hypothetical protein
MGHAVSYRTTFTFNWNVGPIMTLFSDNIAIGWGWGLAKRDVTGSVNYTNGYKKNVSYSSASANAGVVFTFPDRYWHGFLQCEFIRSGSVSLTMYQLTKQNMACEVQGQYGHAIITVSGVGASISSSGTGGVSISFKVGYDTSPLKEKTITV